MNRAVQAEPKAGNDMEIKADGLHCQIHFSAPDREGWMGARVDVVVPDFEGSEK